MLVKSEYAAPTVQYMPYDLAVTEYHAVQVFQD